MVSLGRTVAAAGAGLAMIVTSAGSVGAAGTDVMTFGQDSFGQLGNGTLGPSAMPQTVLLGASDVAGGREHALALADGAVWTWGADDKGQVGDGAGLVNRDSPVKVVTSGATAVATGHYHSMALMTGGSVRAWGWNTKGQIGPSTSLKVLGPASVALPGTATQVAAGRAHSLALVGGDVYTWGDNTHGQLGRAPNTTKNPTPQKVSGLPSSISFIAGGRDTSFAISATGLLYAWGNNSYGQAGAGAIGAGSPTPVLVGSGFTHVESGADHTVARKSDGTVWTWGRNRYGQLGYVSGNRATPRATTLSGITKVFVGRDHSIALASNGGVYTWGRNDGGQLGVGSTDVSQRTTPALVAALAGAVDAGGGQVFSIVLR